MPPLFTSYSERNSIPISFPSLLGLFFDTFLIADDTLDMEPSAAGQKISPLPVFDISIEKREDKQKQNEMKPRKLRDGVDISHGAERADAPVKFCGSAHGVRPNTSEAVSTRSNFATTKQSAAVCAASVLVGLFCRFVIVLRCKVGRKAV